MTCLHSLLLLCCILHIDRSDLNHTQQYTTWLPMIQCVICWTGKRKYYKKYTKLQREHEYAYAGCRIWNNEHDRLRWDVGLHEIVRNVMAVDTEREL